MQEPRRLHRLEAGHHQFPKFTQKWGESAAAPALARLPGVC